MENIIPNVVTILILVIYVLLDKLVLPSLSKNKNGSSDWTRQEYINKDLARRIDRVEKDLSDTRKGLSEIGGDIKVVKAILEEIKNR